MNTKQIALIVIIASAYIVLGFMFQVIAFGVAQIRVADALYPLIAVLGLPCLYGTFLGHLIFNIYGYGVGVSIGMFDLLSPIIFLLPKYLIYKFGFKAVPIHVIFVALWVPLLLFVEFNVPFAVTIVSVGLGETIAEIFLGVPLAVAVKQRLQK